MPAQSYPIPIETGIHLIHDILLRDMIADPGPVHAFHPLWFLQDWLPAVLLAKITDLLLFILGYLFVNLAGFWKKAITLNLKRLR